MARPKTREDVELAKIKADSERERLRSRTIISCFAILAFVACRGIIT